jgi:hypothetical protein
MSQCCVLYVLSSLSLLRITTAAHSVAMQRNRQIPITNECYLHEYQRTFKSCSSGVCMGLASGAPSSLHLEDLNTERGVALKLTAGVRSSNSDFNFGVYGCHVPDDRFEESEFSSATNFLTKTPILIYRHPPKLSRCVERN